MHTVQELLTELAKYPPETPLRLVHFSQDNKVIPVSLTVVRLYDKSLSLITAPHPPEEATDANSG